MKVVKKNVYYCDFCKKKGLNSGHIQKHEKHCTNNPERECRMCEILTGSSLKEIVDDIKSRIVIDETLTEFGPSYDISFTGNPVTIESIRSEVEGCPACMLAVLRQTGLNHWSCAKDFGDHFDYKKESSAYITEKYNNQHHEWL